LLKGGINMNSKKENIKLAIVKIKLLEQKIRLKKGA